MSDPKFKAGDEVKHDESPETTRKIIYGPVKGAHEEAYMVEGLSGAIPVRVLSPATAPEEKPSRDA
jgi:hypothetical protein